MCTLNANNWVQPQKSIFVQKIASLQYAESIAMASRLCVWLYSVLMCMWVCLPVCQYVLYVVT